MALLGAQVVITLVMVLVIQKMGNYSFARWLLCSGGLYRYLSPDNNELKALAGVPRDKPKAKKGGKSEQNGKPEVFHIPRDLDIKLATVPITAEEAVFLRFYYEYQWLLDFSLYSLIVYVISQVYDSIFPQENVMNLSMVWCFLVVMSAFKILLSLTKLYFTSEESVGERSTCIVSFCVFLLIAMMVLIVDDSILEVGVDPAYDKFKENADKFLQNTGLTSVGPASRLIVKLCLAAWAALLGAVLTFPGLRAARMHWDQMQHYEVGKVRLAVDSVGFCLPLLLAAAWLRPLARQRLAGGDNPIMSDATFEQLRLALALLAAGWRLASLRRALQTHLDLAPRRLQADTRVAGRTTNVQLQAKVSSVYRYVCVVALQSASPALLLLFLQLMHCAVRAGDVTPDAGAHVAADVTGADPEHFQLAIENLKLVFGGAVLRGLLGFLAWWSAFAWGAAAALGLAYQSYFRLA